MKNLLAILFISFFLLHEAHAYSFSADTIRSATAGKTIEHRVEIGETLFSISRKYGVAVKDIIQLNPDVEKGLKAGDSIRIPGQQTAVEQPKATALYHTVQPSETLFSIARKYDVNLADLRAKNQLTSDNISPGQKLLIKEGKNAASVQKPLPIPEPEPVQLVEGTITHEVQASETLYSISRKYGVSATDIQKWNQLSGSQLSIGQVLIISDNVSPDKKVVDSVKEINQKAEANRAQRAFISQQVAERNSENAKKISQNGMAERLGNTGDNKKYLALHRTAPQGTIIQVVNDMNGQSVFVRVIGTIPDTGDNQKILIKLSKTAYDRLGAVGDRFPVTLSFVP
ncbi:MAG: LysM peptidoglycan-binding domain-containing protein [Cyclobacteriaceae bacterium]|nr:LysM peptidoglycan-binding domain-containing protein [Cyclobacteriaceae bacterium]